MLALHSNENNNSVTEVDFRQEATLAEHVRECNPQFRLEKNKLRACTFS